MATHEEMLLSAAEGIEFQLKRIADVLTGAVPITHLDRQDFPEQALTDDSVPSRILRVEDIGS